MEDTATLPCPYCFELIDIELPFDAVGEMIHDCDVCCRPGLLRVFRDQEGRMSATLERSQ